MRPIRRVRISRRARWAIVVRGLVGVELLLALVRARGWAGAGADPLLGVVVVEAVEAEGAAGEEGEVEGAVVGVGVVRSGELRVKRASVLGARYPFSVTRRFMKPLGVHGLGVSG